MEAVSPDVGLRDSADTGTRMLRAPRVPTPVVVAILGLVLGSWLLPAFTRQWDDRQKAGEVKASVIAQIASATGGALLDGHEASFQSNDPPPRRSAIPIAGKEWAIANMEIRAKLQAYFGPEAVDHWTLVSQYVSSALSVAYAGPSGDAVIPDLWVSPMKSTRLELVFRRFLEGNDVFEALEIAILAETERLTSSLLDMHVEGYSTTLRDFANDLFPVLG